jgi:hypothetical protein
VNRPFTAVATSAGAGSKPIAGGLRAARLATGDFEFCRCRECRRQEAQALPLPQEGWDQHRRQCRWQGIRPGPPKNSNSA